MILYFEPEFLKVSVIRYNAKDSKCTMLKAASKIAKEEKLKKLYHNWQTFFPVFFSTQTWIIIIVKARLKTLKVFAPVVKKNQPNYRSLIFITFKSVEANQIKSSHICRVSLPIIGLSVFTADVCS